MDACSDCTNWGIGRPARQEVLEVGHAEDCTNWGIGRPARPCKGHIHKAENCTNWGIGRPARPRVSGNDLFYIVPATNLGQSRYLCIMLLIDYCTTAEHLSTRDMRRMRAGPNRHHPQLYFMRFAFTSRAFWKHGCRRGPCRACRPCPAPASSSAGAGGWRSCRSWKPAETSGASCPSSCSSRSTA